MRAVIACTLLALLTGAAQAASDDGENAAKEPADQVCDADAIGQTNKYIDCLIAALSKYDAQLDALVAQIPNSAKAKNDVLDKEVAPSGRQRWRKNFAALVPTFRAYRYKNCEDDAIAAVGYGMGGLQWRLACMINATSRQIDALKKRYELENSAPSPESAAPISAAPGSAVTTTNKTDRSITPGKSSGHCLLKHGSGGAMKGKVKC